jgi:hypothetical protein
MGMVLLFSLSDCIDDVSNRYATYDEIASNFPGDIQSKLAKYITDPSGWAGWENGKRAVHGSQKFDWVNYMNLQPFSPHWQK